MVPLDPKRREELDALLLRTPYAVLRTLGRGAMGEVFLVEHRFLGRRFALKLMHDDIAREPTFIERFRLEARALGRLEHPHVVEVVDLGTGANGALFVVLELLRGRTLRDELQMRRKLPPEEALRWMRQVLDGLAAAHALGLVHRDIKPENLFLHEPLVGERLLKILDFGLARIVPGAPYAELDPTGIRTTTGALVGSPRYMSPEALRGERLDARSDVFGAGLVLYEMLVGYGPFDFDDGPPAPPSTRVLGLPPALDEVVLRALALSPEARYADGAAFLAACEHVARALHHPSSP